MIAILLKNSKSLHLFVLRMDSFFTSVGKIRGHIDNSTVELAFPPLLLGSFSSLYCTLHFAVGRKIQFQNRFADLSLRRSVMYALISLLTKKRFVRIKSFVDQFFLNLDSVEG